MAKIKTKRFLNIESALRKQGFLRIAGLDEAGRGPLAGPLVCASVVLKKNVKLAGVNDCKLLTSSKREKLFALTIKSCDYGISAINERYIDKYGLIKACEEGFRRACAKLKQKPDILLIDGDDAFSLKIPFKSFIKGDRLIRSIAAASVLAKVYRDRIMRRLHKKYPRYRFDMHKGYGTRLHGELLKKFGPCKIHRRRFRPVFEIENVAQLPLDTYKI